MKYNTEEMKKALEAKKAEQAKNAQEKENAKLIEEAKALGLDLTQFEIKEEVSEEEKKLQAQKEQEEKENEEKLKQQQSLSLENSEAIVKQVTENVANIVKETLTKDKVVEQPEEGVYVL